MFVSPALLLAIAGPLHALHGAPAATGDDDAPAYDPEPRSKHYLRAIEEELIFLGPFGLSLYWINQDFNQQDWDLKWNWVSWKRKLITFDAVRFDSNDFWTNAATHAASGGIYYWLPRANGLSVLESFVFATFGSLTWEYLVEFKEDPSINDIIYTPFVGMAVGESVYQLGELFDRGSDGLGVRILAEIFGAPRKLHDRLDGVRSRGAERMDALGLPADVFHRFTLSGGYERTWIPGSKQRPENRTELAFSSEVVDLPRYGRVGRANRFVQDRGFTRLAIEASMGDRRVERLMLDARATLFGWYYQDVERDGRGGLRGGSVFLGATTELDYTQRWIGALQDRLAVVRMFGPALDTIVHAGRLTLHASLDVTMDFAMVTPLAGPEWLPNEHVRSKSVVQDSGYYYAVGLSADPRVTVGYGPFDVGVSGRIDTFSSIDGRDRLQDQIVDDAHLSDRRLEWQVLASVSPLAPLHLQTTLTQRYREGHVAGLSASSLERSVFVGGALTF